jgi:enoyl-CoA hydratase
MNVEVQRDGAIAVVRLKAGRANALSADLLRDLEHTFAELAKSDAAAAVVTGEGNAFSAGLALTDLIALERGPMRDFITLFERAMQRMLVFPRALVAAVNGHAIAGGCVAALMCDVRIAAAGNAKIGLNEIQLGIGLPSLVIEPLRARVPAQSLTPLAYEGRLFGVDEALRLGVIDEIVAPAELEARALARARELAKAPAAYAQIKQALLRPVIEAITRNAMTDREAWLDSWFSENAQRTLKATVERLTAKK